MTYTPFEVQEAFRIIYDPSSESIKTSNSVLSDGSQRAKLYTDGSAMDDGLFGSLIWWLR